MEDLIQTPFSVSVFTLFFFVNDVFSYECFNNVYLYSVNITCEYLTDPLTRHMTSLATSKYPFFYIVYVDYPNCKHAIDSVTSLLNFNSDFRKLLFLYCSSVIFHCYY